MTKNEILPGGVELPARRIPAPVTVSAQAQAFLAAAPNMVMKPPSDPKDKVAWRTFIDMGAQWLAAQMAANAEPYPSDIHTHALSQTSLFEVVPKSLSPAWEHCAILYIHGGAFIHGAGLAGAYMGAPLTSLARMRSFCVDYRMPPDHPFPTGLEDAVEAYRWVLQRYKPENIVFAGGSAGGGLAAALALKVRDLGLPMPGACILATPEADLTESGDSFETNQGIDVVTQVRLTESIAVYADGHDLRDPYLSPVFGDYSKGFPPTILTTGTRDMFLSNTVLMHRLLLRAGVEAELHVWEAMPHGGFFGAPEDLEVLEQQVRFIHKRLSPAAIR